jgi:hypothetical protein
MKQEFHTFSCKNQMSLTFHAKKSQLILQKGRFLQCFRNEFENKQVAIK